MYDELIKRLRDAAKISEGLAVLLHHSEGNATAKLYNEAADAIEELSKPKWIPVTERLPENYCNCIVFSDGYVKEAHFCLENFYDPIEDYMRYKATHWMPLPEPPKEE